MSIESFEHTADHENKYIHEYAWRVPVIGSRRAETKRNSLTLAVYIVPCRQAAETHIQPPKAPLQINEAAQQRGYMWIKLTFLAILLPSALTIVGMSVGHGPSLQLPLPRMCSKGSGSASAKQHTERASAHRFLPRTTPTRPSARRALPRCR